MEKQKLYGLIIVAIGTFLGCVCMTLSVYVAEVFFMG